LRARRRIFIQKHTVIVEGYSLSVAVSLSIASTVRGGLIFLDRVVGGVAMEAITAMLLPFR
jgi:F0F1-type ATP synthase assembly protein I